MKTLTQAAQAAKAIKQELKKAYPQIRFSVKSDNFSMGNSVDISWNDGPSTDEVENITNKYQYGHFNGMEDIYEDSNSRDDIPQAKYVSCNRHFVELEPLREEFNKITNSESWSNSFYSVIRKQSFPFGATNFRIERTDKTCGLLEDLYKIGFDSPGKEIKINGSFVIVDYSEKAVAVFGDTKPVKEQLKSFGGRFNPYLNNEGKKQAGWIFPAAKKSELETLLNNAVHTPKEEINLSESLRKKAEATEKQADNIDDSVKGNWTHRRQGMADSMRQRKESTYKISRILYALSEGWENGTIDQDLKVIKSKSDVEHLLHGYFPNPPDSLDGWYAEQYETVKKKTNALGIYSAEQFSTLKKKLQSLGEVELTQEQKKENEKSELLKQIHATNIPGFFPTPDELIDRMIDLSGITHVNSILEPSAGIGSIAEKLTPLCDRLECCEINWTLYSYLEHCGFNMVSRDVLEHSGTYDAIFMNPPFENREDLRHIMHCYDLLNDSSVLVSIISAGTLKNWFTDWLNDKVYEIHDVEQGMFKASFNSTGVSVKIIVINK